MGRLTGKLCNKSFRLNKEPMFSPNNPCGRICHATQQDSLMAETPRDPRSVLNATHTKKNLLHTVHRSPQLGQGARQPTLMSIREVIVFISLLCLKTNTKFGVWIGSRWQDFHTTHRVAGTGSHPSSKPHLDPGSPPLPLD